MGKALKIVNTPLQRSVFLYALHLEAGKGSGKTGFSRGGSIETERFQGAKRPTMDSEKIKKRLQAFFLFTPQGSIVQEKLILIRVYRFSLQFYMLQY
jgi:hypothetical protein